jgi:Fe-S-cluster containining protein
LGIAGLRIALHDVDEVLSGLAALEREFAGRAAEYAAEPANPHLCYAGCSGCCRSGAVFAVTLVESVRWARAIDALPTLRRQSVRADAARLVVLQEATFAGAAGPPDVPGARSEPVFSARVARFAESGAACPVLDGDFCGAYEARPFLCRAYGLPVDAYAVEDEGSMTFRSLCRLYAGHELGAWVRARDLRARLDALSIRLAGGRDTGRFTSVEALLATIEGSHA